MPPIAAAPPRCVTMNDLGAETHRGAAAWALAAQIYSLRRAGDDGIGDFGSVAALARAAGKRGATALAVSPAHALFAADATQYGPYAPSSRILLNTLYADPTAALGSLPEAPPVDAELIDWPAATARKLARLRALFEHPRRPRAATSPSSATRPARRWRTMRGSRRCTPA